MLQSFSAPRPTTNPYLRELLTRLGPEVDVRTFTWRTALLDDYDVLHLHWPEVLVRKTHGLRTAMAQVLFALLLLRCRLRRTAVVRTLHNVMPHERGSRREDLLLTWTDRSTTWWISLNGLDGTTPADRTTTILHGHYRDWYRHHHVPDSVPGRMGFVGLIREYKNVPGLLAAFRGLDRPDASLVIAGMPRSDFLRHTLQEQVSSDHRVTADLDHVPESDIARVVGESQVVVLPYAEFGNSGAALLTLSLGRPVLVPANSATRSLAAEVGGEWVTTYDDTLSPADLSRALAETATLGCGRRPDLSLREWDQAGRRHRDVYAVAVRFARDGRR